MPACALKGPVAAISVGVVGGRPMVDLCYAEDHVADVDLNVVMLSDGRLIEVQGTGEEATFSRTQLDRLLKLGKLGVDAVTARQRQALGAHWPLD